MNLLTSKSDDEIVVAPFLELWVRFRTPEVAGALELFVEVFHVCFVEIVGRQVRSTTEPRLLGS